MSEVGSGLFWRGIAEFNFMAAWVSWLNISVLLATLSLGLFNASKDDVARRFAYVYAVISVCVLVRFFLLDQPPSHMVYLDLRLLSLPTPDKYDSSQRPWTFRYALSLTHFSSFTKYPPTDALAGPVILSIALFVAVLANFIIRGTSQFKFKNCSRLT